MYRRLRPLVLVSLALGLLGACKKGERAATGGKCDQAALAALAERLDAAEPEQRVAIVGAGLPDACNELLPDTTRFYLREVAERADARPDERRMPPSSANDAELQAAKSLACPKLAALDAKLSAVEASEYAKVVYEVCDYQRYDVIPAADFAEHVGTGWLTWTTHALLLADGTPPQIAGTITRAMFLFETVEFGLHAIPSLPGQRLPKLGGTQIPTGVVVHASTTEMQFQEQLLVSLHDGALPPEAVAQHLIRPLYDVLDEEAEKLRAGSDAGPTGLDARIILAFDERLPFTTVIDTLYTGGRAGFVDYAFIVEPHYPLERALLASPPKWTAFGDPPPPPLTVLISDDGFRVRFPGDEDWRSIPKRDPAGTAADAWDQARLAKLVDEFMRANPELRSASITPDNHLSLGVMLGTAATLLGPSCDQAQRETCLLPDLIIAAGAE